VPFMPKEVLPGEHCPPENAIAMNGRFVRLVEEKNIKDTFCHSNNALGIQLRKNADPCIWAACSLIIYDESWVDGPLARVRDFADRVGLLRHKKYGAILEIKRESGLGHRGTEDSPHVSFWMAANFNPQKALIDVVSLL
jgi:hypothetical protein